MQNSIQHKKCVFGGKAKNRSPSVGDGVKRQVAKSMPHGQVTIKRDLVNPQTNISHFCQLIIIIEQDAQIKIFKLAIFQFTI